MKRALYFLVPAILLAGLIAWRLQIKNAETAAQLKTSAARKKAPAIVTAATAQYQDIVHTYQAVGTVESPLNIKIASKLAGRIDFLQAREGDRVHAGQLMVVIDPSEIQGQVAQAQAGVAEAQQRLAQAQLTTNATNVGVASQIAQQRAAVASTQANYNQTKENYAAQVAAAQAAVTDAQAKVDAASSGVKNAQASLHSAQVNLTNLQTIYNRTNTLYKQGFVAAQDVDTARTQADVQQAAVEQAQQQVSSAQSQLNSTQAEKASAQDQYNITVVKGKSDIEAALQALNQSKAALSLAIANRSQSPAYLANLRALQSAVVAAQGQLANTKAQLANTQLRTPIDGYVTQRLADPGSTATVGQALLNIQASGAVYVTTNVPEEIVRFLHVGMTGQAVFDALPGQSFTGRITQVDPAADPTTRQFLVRITLDNPKGVVKAGMFAQVTFVTQRIPHALVVPREAVQTGSQGTYAIVIAKDGTAKRVPVTVGDSIGSVTQVLSGLEPGDQVVTLSYQAIKDGQKVSISTAPATPGTTGSAGASGSAAGASGSAAGAGTSGH
jgi:RND family efflux transporter MFP subunit